MTYAVQDRKTRNENVERNARRGGDPVKVPVRRGHGIILALNSLIRREPWSVGSSAFDRGGWIAGGFARWCCSPSDSPAPADDIDVFFADTGALRATQAHLERLGARVTREVSYFVELDTGDLLSPLPPKRLQLIKPFVEDGARSWGPTIRDVVRQIDITVCRVAINSVEHALADPAFEDDERDRIVAPVCINDPVAVMVHSLKYVAKGYSMRSPEIVSVFNNWTSQPGDYRLSMTNKGRSVDGYGEPE